jgi:fatty acid synthase subunit alpha, fungi type
MKSFLTKLLCELIFTKPIHWTKACNFPETVTHALDFCPDGLSGCGFTAAHSLDDHGIRVVIVGDKSKGIVELDNGQIPGMRSGKVRSTYQVSSRLGTLLI